MPIVIEVKVLEPVLILGQQHDVQGIPARVPGWYVFTRFRALQHLYGEGNLLVDANLMDGVV